MRGYISKIDIDELIRKRKEFWGKTPPFIIETRVEGEKEIWMTLHACCEEIEEKEIPLFLEAAGIKIYKDCLNVTFDSKGESYEIPNYCINPPYCYDLSLTKKRNKKNVNLHKEIPIVVRYFANIFELTVIENENVLILKERINLMYNNKKPTHRIEPLDIRLFYGGKELKNENEIFSYNIVPDSIILMNLVLK